jgi:HK97 gp10 family phage protein
MILKTQITGASEINKVLKQLPDRTQKRQLQAAARKGANVIRDAAVARAPFGTEQAAGKYGHLRDNIKVTAARGNNASSVRVVINTGKAFWGNFLEFGTRFISARPFMRPALDETAGKAIGEVGKALGKGVEKEAAILAGPYAKARKSFGLK